MVDNSIVDFGRIGMGKGDDVISDWDDEGSVSFLLCLGDGSRGEDTLNHILNSFRALYVSSDHLRRQKSAHLR